MKNKDQVKKFVIINGLMYTGGLTIHVYKSNLQDGSCNGVSNKYDTLLLVGPNIPNVSDIQDENKVVFIVDRHEGSDQKPYYYLQPYTEIKSHCMMGGCFGSSTDSRFSKISSYPLPIFDRVERG
jgi:hypothetical protein